MASLEGKRHKVWVGVGFFLMIVDAGIRNVYIYIYIKCPFVQPCNVTPPQKCHDIEIIGNMQSMS